MTEGPNVRPKDALQVAQRALQKCNELEENLKDLRADHADMLEELTAMQLRLSEIDDDTDYRDLSLDTKVGMVREHAYQKAVNGHGRAALTYDDVMWEVFDGEPGNNHCYRLLRRAAGYNNDGEQIHDIPGFNLDESSRPMKLTVNASEAKAGVAFSSRNNPVREEVR
ncbi:hypothetical protein [Natrinema halophilum]|uniref:Uncharacterized protein n=1 Tax=Natrinema halophilum TaxID=1699371 RepID=A0A7D5H5B4_9EURY|nr:hypothetical protein [Natrinema halophilum]QLG47915.1 hypothetical protein HYG82_03165 [Natrinema halophilum]